MIGQRIRVDSAEKNLFLILCFLLGASFLGFQIVAQDHSILAICILGVTSLVLIAKRPVLGLYLIAVLTPLNQLQQFEFPLFSSVIRVIGLVTLLSFLAHYLITPEYRFIRTELFPPMSVFVFAYIVGLYRSYEVNGALTQVLVLSMYFALYLLVVNLVRDRKTLTRMFVVLTLVASALAVFGILQFFTGKTFFTPGTENFETFGVGGQSVIRVIGLFDNPNAFAYNYVLVIPLMIGLLLTQRKRLHQLTIIALLATCTLCLFLTFSRSAFLALWVSVFIILLFMKSPQKVMIGIGFLGVLTAVYALTPDLFDILHFRMLSASNYMGIHQRIDLVKGGIVTFSTHPFIGSGTRNAPIMLGEYTYNFRHGAHNNLIAVLVETGLLGFIPFCLIFINFTKKILAGISRTVDRNSRILLVAILASIWGYFVNGLFHTSLAYGLWWMILGMGMAYANISEGNGHLNGKFALTHGEMEKKNSLS
jgi:O-antigen ligase